MREGNAEGGRGLDRKPIKAAGNAHVGRWWAPGDIVIVLAVAALCAVLIAQGITEAGAGSSLEAVVIVNGKGTFTDANAHQKMFYRPKQ